MDIHFIRTGKGCKSCITGCETSQIQKVASSLHYVPSKATIEVFPSRLDTLGTDFLVDLQHRGTV